MKIRQGTRHFMKKKEGVLNSLTGIGCFCGMRCHHTQLQLSHECYCHGGRHLHGQKILPILSEAHKHI